LTTTGLLADRRKLDAQAKVGRRLLVRQVAGGGYLLPTTAARTWAKGHRPANDTGGREVYAPLVGRLETRCVASR
jgi:hypothetical protein